jgi:hypothetical protein
MAFVVKVRPPPVKAMVFFFPYSAIDRLAVLRHLISIVPASSVHALGDVVDPRANGNSPPYVATISTNSPSD